MEREGAKAKLLKASKRAGRRGKGIQIEAANDRSFLLAPLLLCLSHLVRDGLVGLDLLRLLGGVSVLARDEQEQRDEANAREGAGEASHFGEFFLFLLSFFLLEE